MEVKSITLPASDALKQHPGLYDIYVLLYSGWPPHRTAELVRARYPGHELRVADIIDYLYLLPETSTVGTKIDPELEHEDVIVDVVGEMVDMLRFTKRRIQAQSLMEDTSGKADAGIDKSVKNYFDMLYKYLQALKLVDFFPTGAGLPAPMVEPAEDVMSLQDILDEREGSAAVPALPAPELQ